jgi:glutathione S-transferase
MSVVMPILGSSLGTGALMKTRGWPENRVKLTQKRKSKLKATGKSRLTNGKTDMKLYITPRAPNPRRVLIFLAEKGITVPTESVDLGGLQQKSPQFTALNPLQRVPVLVFDDGAILTESIAICRYFEAQQPEPRLFGHGAREEAFVEMWQRRAEFHLLLPVSQVFRHLHPAMKDMEVPQVPDWGEANRPRVMEFLAYLDSELKGRRFVAGEHYSVADITTLVAVDFMKPAKLTVPAELSNVMRWHVEVSARPSAKAG